MPCNHETTKPWFHGYGHSHSMKPWNHRFRHAICNKTCLLKRPTNSIHFKKCLRLWKCALSVKKKTPYFWGKNKRPLGGGGGQRLFGIFPKFINFLGCGRPLAEQILRRTPMSDPEPFKIPMRDSWAFKIPMSDWWAFKIPIGGIKIPMSNPGAFKIPMTVLRAFKIPIGGIKIPT